MLIIRKSHLICASSQDGTTPSIFMGITFCCSKIFGLILRVFFQLHLQRESREVSRDCVTFEELFKMYALK